MFENQAIQTEHKDVIHDVAYDYYGQRMATCSSDQFVKVSVLSRLCRPKIHLTDFRFGIKMRMAHGVLQPAGRHTPDPFGDFRGLIPSSVKFSRHVHSTEQFRFGRKLSARRAPLQCRRLNVGFVALTWSIHAQA